MEINELRELLHESIKQAIANGWNIDKHLWVSKTNKQCCPLGAIAVHYDTPDTLSKRAEREAMEEVLDNIFDMDSNKMYSFADGFDGQYYDRSKHVKEYWDLGVEFRGYYA